MDTKIKVNENQILSIIENVLRENRKVIKVGGGAPQGEMPPMPSAPTAPPMGGAPMDPSMGGGAPMEPNAPMDPSMGGAPMGDGNGMDSQFDTNFDAGVEADEETDPKRYIQQLTGKLSQSLNSFNSEQGPDAGLSKYVASMIIAAACKNLDEKAKKELIEKINTASSDEDMPEDGDAGMEGEMPMDDGAEMGGDEQMQQPMNERILTRRELAEMVFGKRNVSESIFTKKKLKEMMDACCGDKRPKETNKKAVSPEIPKAWKGKSQINGSKH